MRDLPVFPRDPFTPADLEASGVSKKQLKEAVFTRQVIRLLRGVYVRADVPDSIALRCQAASLVVSPHSVVRDRTAAWLHGLDVLDYPELEILPPVETSVPRFRAPTRREGHDGVTRDLSADDIQRLHGVFVTTPLRTALDLGCSLPVRSALAVLDAFARRYGFSREQLDRGAARFRGRRGVRQLRLVSSMMDAGAESSGESWTRYCLIDAGLPEPVTQHWVEIEGVPTYRLDLAYPMHKVAIEFDGEEFHESLEARIADEERREALRQLGWIVIVVTRRSFTPDAIKAWTQQVRAALNSRRWRAGSQLRGA